MMYIPIFQKIIIFLYFEKEASKLCTQYLCRPHRIPNLLGSASVRVVYYGFLNILLLYYPFKQNDETIEVCDFLTSELVQASHFKFVCLGSKDMEGLKKALRFKIQFQIVPYHHHLELKRITCNASCILNCLFCTCHQIYDFKLKFTIQDKICRYTSLVIDSMMKILELMPEINFSKTMLCYQIGCSTSRDQSSPNRQLYFFIAQ